MVGSQVTKPVFSPGFSGEDSGQIITKTYETATGPTATQHNGVQWVPQLFKQPVW